MDLVPFDFRSIVNVNLDEIESEYRDLPDTATKDGLELLNKRARKLQKFRTGVEKKRKEVNQQAQYYIKSNNSNAKEIVDKILQIEEPYKAEKKRIADEEARIKREAEEREERRKKAITDKINDIILAGSQRVYGKNSTELLALLDDIEKIDTSFGFDEYEVPARNAKSSTVTAIKQHIAQVKAQEEEANRVEIERKKLEEEREKIRIEQEKREAEEERVRKELEEERKKLEAEREAYERRIKEAEKVEVEDANQVTENKEEEDIVVKKEKINMNLENLLRMEIKGTSIVTGDDISYPPEFRVAVQNKTDDGVHIIIHASGHNSDTLDFLVRGNELVQM